MKFSYNLLQHYTDLPSVETLVDLVTNREVDILIGTQIMAKGHHFPGLQLVGVVDADLGLSGGDLRAGEKTYQLLHQISGRAGRAQVAGLQAPGPLRLEHDVACGPIFHAAARSDHRKTD